MGIPWWLSTAVSSTFPYFPIIDCTWKEQCRLDRSGILKLEYFLLFRKFSSGSEGVGPAMSDNMYEIEYKSVTCQFDTL